MILFAVIRPLTFSLLLFKHVVYIVSLLFENLLYLFECVFQLGNMFTDVFFILNIIATLCPICKLSKQGKIRTNWLSDVRNHEPCTLHRFYTFNIINRYLFDDLALLGGNI